MDLWWFFYRYRYRIWDALQSWRRRNWYWKRDWYISDLRRRWHRDWDFFDFRRRRHAHRHHDLLYGGWARYRDGVRYMFHFWR